MNQFTHCKIGQQQTLEFLPDKIRRFVAKDDFRTQQMASQLLQGPLNLPTFMTEAPRFSCRGFPRIQDRSHNAINGLSLRLRFELLLYHSDKLPTTATKLIFPRREGEAQIGTTRQALLRSQLHVLLDPAQKLRITASGLIPKIKPEEATVFETPHILLQESKNPFYQRPFPLLVVPYLGAEGHMVPIFHQGDESKLEKRASSFIWLRPADRFFAGRLHSAVIGTHQWPYPVLDSFHLSGGNRSHYLVMQLPQGIYTQSGKELRGPRFLRDPHLYRRVQQPRHPLQQAPQDLSAGQSNMEGRRDYEIDSNLNRRIRFLNARFFGNGQSRIHFLHGKGLSQYTEVHYKKNTFSEQYFP